LVCVTKYRRRIFDSAALNWLAGHFRKVCETVDCRLIASDGEADHVQHAGLPRERIVIPAPERCPCCGSTKLSKLGEDITETLEVIPRQWKVIQTVPEKFSCRECATITQPPAPFHVTPRGFAGHNLLAMILFEKFGQHQPLNRQSERHRREGIDLGVSTLADQVGACATVLQPLHALIERHVLSAERLHGDDTTVPIWPRATTTPSTGLISCYPGIGSRPTDHVNWRHDRRFSFDMARLFDVAGSAKGRYVAYGA
jgi:transposase